jgi:hypothetical protein
MEQHRGVSVKRPLVNSLPLPRRSQSQADGRRGGLGLDAAFLAALGVTSVQAR